MKYSSSFFLDFWNKYAIINQSFHHQKELHACCEKLEVDIECWGICMGDCTETEIDPIFYMTECGDTLKEVAEQCCSEITTESVTNGNL